MPESKSSEGSKDRRNSSFLVGAGGVVMALGAGLAHPALGLLLFGLILVVIGIAGYPKRA